MRTDSKTLAAAMRIAADEMLSGDGVVPAAMREAAKRIDELEAIINKLPKTADGVPVTPGMKLYSGYTDSHNEVRVMGFTCSQDGKMTCLYFAGGFDAMPEKYYSTPEAAKEAADECD